MKRVIHINFLGSGAARWRSLPHIGLRNFTAHHLIPTKANHTSYIPSPARRRRRPLSSSHKNEPAAIEPTAHDYLVLKITHPDSRYHEWLLQGARPSTVRSQGPSYECGDVCELFQRLAQQRNSGVQL